MLLKGLGLFFFIGAVLSQAETESKVGPTEEIIETEEDDLVCKYNAPDIGDVEITYQESEEGYMVVNSVPDDIADPKERLNACIAEEDVQGRKSQNNRPNRRNNKGKGKNKNRSRINSPGKLLQRTRNLIKGNPNQVTITEMKAVIRNAQQFIRVKTNQRKRKQQANQRKGGNKAYKQGKENIEEKLVEE